MIRTWALFAVLISGALLQEPVLGAADSERRNCHGVRGVLSEVPEASMSTAAALPFFATGLVGLVLLLAQEEEGIINGHIIFDIVSALVSVASQANPVLSAWYRTGSLPPEHKLPKVADRNTDL